MNVLFTFQVLANETKKQQQQQQLHSIGKHGQKMSAYPGGPGGGGPPGVGGNNAVKRPASSITQPPPPNKKPKLPGIPRDVSLAEAGRYGTLKEYAFFDQVQC